MEQGVVDRLKFQLMRKLQGWAEENRTIEGFRVTLVNTRPDIDSELVFRRLESALALIRRYQPLRFSRMQRDFARIQICRYPCRAAYFPDSRVCLIELTFLANSDFSVAQKASSIVHEGIHARIHAMGVAYDPSQRPREERMCRTAELEFGRSIPNGDAVVQRALQSLQLDDVEVAPVIDWTEAKQAIASADANATARGARS